VTTSRRVKRRHRPYAANALRSYWSTHAFSFSYVS